MIALTWRPFHGLEYLTLRYPGLRCALPCSASAGALCYRPLSWAKSYHPLSRVKSYWGIYEIFIPPLRLPYIRSISLIVRLAVFSLANRRKNVLRLSSHNRYFCRFSLSCSLSAPAGIAEVGRERES